MKDITTLPLNSSLGEESKGSAKIELAMPSCAPEPLRSRQFCALFCKTTSLLLRQKANIVVQVLTPLIGICIVMLFKELMASQIRNFAPVYNLQFPFFANLPYGMVRDSGTLLFTTNCDQVFLLLTY